MGRKILITVGVSLLVDFVSEREGLKDFGFAELSTGGITPRTLTDLAKALEAKEEAEKVAGSASDFNPHEARWNKACDGLVRAIGKLWSLPSMYDLQRYRYSGAELASVARLGQGNAVGFGPLREDDEVILLESDTARGIFCAHVIKQALAAGVLGLPVVQSRIVRINGLQPYDSERFLTLALRELTLLLHTFDEPNSILLASGGYKAILPILSILAMHHRMPILYLYEDASSLLAMEPLPVVFDLEVVKAYDKVLQQLVPAKGSRVVEDGDVWWREASSQVGRNRGLSLAETKGEIKDAKLIEELPGNRIRMSATGILQWYLCHLGGTPEGPTDSGGLLS